MEKTKQKFMTLSEFKKEFIPDSLLNKEQQDRLVTWDPSQRAKEIVDEACKKYFPELSLSTQ